MEKNVCAISLAKLREIAFQRFFYKSTSFDFIFVLLFLAGRAVVCQTDFTSLDIFFTGAKCLNMVSSSLCDKTCVRVCLSLLKNLVARTQVCVSVTHPWAQGRPNSFVSKETRW